MENSVLFGELNLKDTELRLGLPGSEEAQKRCSVIQSKKRCSPEETSGDEESLSFNGSNTTSDHDDQLENKPPAK